MPTTDRPAISLVASPGRRAAVLDLAVEAEQRGFAGIACPSMGTAMGLAVSLAHVTREIPFWTSIQPIYLSNAAETAGLASHVAELSGGRFRLGLGISHAPLHRRIGVEVGPPLEDTRAYVSAVRTAMAPLPADLPPIPIYLAALRDGMLALAAEVADGAIWANAALSAIPAQLARVDGARRDGFFRSSMLPTVIDDDRQAAAAVNRKTMSVYLTLPNYRRYWRAAGYAEEMDAVEAALETGERDGLPSLVSDRWLDDVTLSGSAATVREGLEAWHAAGVLPIAVMSSTSGGQVKAVQELLDAYS